MSALPHRLAGHLGLRAPDRPLLHCLAGTGDPGAQIELLAKSGFAGVQDNFLASRPADEQIRIGAAAKACGLELGTFVHDPLHWDQPTWSASTATNRSVLLSQVAESIECAKRTGATRTTCVTAFDHQRPRKEQLAAMADNLTRAADLAAGSGLKFCVEATAATRIPGMLVESLTNALWVIEQANRATVTLMLDVGHVAMNGEDVPSAIRRAHGRIGGVQIADVLADTTDRIDPGAGTLEWKAIFATLAEVNYTGLIDVELEAMEDTTTGERRLLARLSQLGL